MLLLILLMSLINANIVKVGINFTNILMNIFCINVVINNYDIINFINVVITKVLLANK